jgi:hypothetical protein
MIKARPAAKALSVLAIGAMYFSASPVRAHHSPRIFDMGSVLAFEATVSRVHWANPHTYYYVEAPGADGELVEWQLETDAITLLLRSGWTEESLRPGDRVVVRGHPDIGTGTSGIETSFQSVGAMGAIHNRLGAGLSAAGESAAYRARRRSESAIRSDVRRSGRGLHRLPSAHGPDPSVLRQRD